MFKKKQEYNLKPATGKAQKAKLLEHLGGLYDGRVDGCLTTFLHIIDHSFETIQARSGVLTIPSHAIPTNHPHVLSYPIQPTNQPSSSQSSFLSSSQPPQPSPKAPQGAASQPPRTPMETLEKKETVCIPSIQERFHLIIELKQAKMIPQLNSVRMSFFTSDRTCKSNVFQLPPVLSWGIQGSMKPCGETSHFRRYIPMIQCWNCMHCV